MIIFVSDFFKQDILGGAELTTEVLIERSLLPVVKLHSRSCTKKIMNDNKNCHWIFGNFSHLSRDLILHAYKNLNYSIIEYDYKYCKYRNSEIHRLVEKKKCECHQSSHGKVISIFFQGAKSLWWMSEQQKQCYHDKFPFLQEKKSHVLSSIFSRKTLNNLSSLRNQESGGKKWIIMNSGSPVKGVQNSIKFAQDNGHEFDLVSGLQHEDFIKKIHDSRGMIFLPIGPDTCPRMIIETKLLARDLIINDYVQHKDEEWFSGRSPEEIESYLMNRPEIFWDQIAGIMGVNVPRAQNSKSKNHFTIVIPAYNCAPWIEKNLLSALKQRYDNFNIIYIDDSSNDKTSDIVNEIMKSEDKDNKITLIKNDNNKKALYNIDKAIDLAPEDSIIVLLDGDDWFPNFDVLSELDEIYTDDIWITAGSYMESSTGRVIESLKSDSSAWQDNIRRHHGSIGTPNIFSHLRTFRKRLFEKIEKEDLKDHDGKHYQCTFDRALMYPMLEMAGPQRYHSVEKIMYIYNRHNPLSVDRVQREDQLRIEQQIRNKPQYKKLQSL